MREINVVGLTGLGLEPETLGIHESRSRHSWWRRSPKSAAAHGRNGHRAKAVAPSKRDDLNSDVVPALKKPGFIEKRQKASHVILWHGRQHRTTIVAVHGRDIPMALGMAVYAFYLKFLTRPDYLCQIINESCRK
jgi:predicted RNA binding protein YcfA (HicA-like mRNA interferase family)